MSLECARHSGALVQSVGSMLLPGGDSELERTLETPRKGLQPNSEEMVENVVS